MFSKGESKELLARQMRMLGFAFIIIYYYYYYLVVSLVCFVSDFFPVYKPRFE